MTEPRTRGTERVWIALVGVVACALVHVLPFTGSSASVAELAAVSLAVLALAGALASAPRSVLALPMLVTGHPVAGDAGPPVLRTRTTDPTHHPLAPRAPGRG